MATDFNELIATPDREITLDSILEIFTRTILHPTSCWCFAAYFVLQGWAGSVWSNALWYSVVFGILVDGFYLLAVLNRWLISAPRRKLGKEHDLIVVTGGSSGLGMKICAILGIRGYRVVNLDIKRPELDVPNVEFVQCDVSDPNDVKTSKELINKKFGSATVLINNAGITNNKTVTEIDEHQIRKIIDINLMSHFWMAKAFLPDMIGLSRGHIVTVSSVLGYIAPAGLSSYCASKAGLVAFHDCLTHEVKKSGVKTLLVTPGQMNSDLFKGVSTPNSFFAPVVSTLEFAEKIVNAIEDGRCGEIAEPFYAKLVPFSRLMPQSVLEMLRGIFKIDKAMETYIGEN